MRATQNGDDSSHDQENQHPPDPGTQPGRQDRAKNVATPSENLTTEHAVAGGLTPHGTRPFDPALDREIVRSRTALILVGTLAGSVIAAFVTLWVLALSNRGLASEYLRNVLTIIFPPLIGVVGTVAGFYFAGRGRD